VSGSTLLTPWPVNLHHPFATRYRIPMRLRRALAALFIPTLLAAQREPYRDPTRPVAERVRDLLSRMSLDDKFWQLFMIPGSLDDSTHDYSHGVFGLQRFEIVATGFGTHTCGITVDTSILCWGLGSEGQLGDGYTRDRQSLPVGVLAPAP